MILIDNRIGSKELAPYIHTRSRLTRLEYADFMFMGHGANGPVKVGIERKVIGDLVSSISSGRLSGHQLIGLLESYGYTYLLVEGLWRPNPQSGILEKMKGRKWVNISHGNRKFMARDIWNFLNTLAVMCGVVVIYTDNIKQSGYWIDSTYHWWSKGWDQHKSHLQFKNQLPPTSGTQQKMKLHVHRPTPFERILVGITGLGWETVGKLKRRFNSPLEVAMATEKALMEVDGVGRKTAQTIIREMRGES